MKIAFGSDHAGFELRTSLESYAKSRGHEVLDFGAMSAEPYDYPLAADPVCAEVLAGRVDFGVLICGSGVGISIRANRHPGIRCANCWNSTVAELARMHNHANVLAIGARLTDAQTAQAMLDTFIATEPDASERHVRRIHQLDEGCS